jgi:hypothetical protein
MLTGTTLQEDIAATARRVVEQGQCILGLNIPRTTPPVYDRQTSAPTGSATASAAQL